MTTRDLHSNIKATPALNAQSIATNTTVNGAIIDTLGFESLEFLIQSATITDGTFAPSLTEGSQANLSDGAAVAAADMIGTVAAATFIATDDNVTKKLGYKGSKRYVRLSLTSTGVTTGGAMSGTAVLGDPHHAPVA